MMTIRLLPRFQLGPNERADNSKLNRLGTPTAQIVGMAGADQIAGASIDASKTVPGPHFLASACVYTPATLTYAITFTPDVAVVNGLEIVFEADANCLAASLLSLNGAAAKPIQKFVTMPLESSDILDGQMVKVRWSALKEAWLLLNPTPQAVSTALPGQFSGLRVSNNPGTPTLQIDLAAEARGAMVSMHSASHQTHVWYGDAGAIATINLTLGAQKNGCDWDIVATPIAAGWHYVYLIYGTAGGVAGIFSKSLTGPALPDDFSYWTLLSAVYITTTTLPLFSQVGRTVILIEPATVAETISAVSAANWTSLSLAAHIPPIAVEWSGTLGVSNAVVTPQPNATNKPAGPWEAAWMVAANAAGLGAVSLKLYIGEVGDHARDFGLWGYGALPVRMAAVTQAVWYKTSTETGYSRLTVTSYTI